MRYLVQPQDEPPLFTEWFTVENCYAEGMIVYDLSNNLYTTDGKRWEEIDKFDSASSRIENLSGKICRNLDRALQMIG